MALLKKVTFTNGLPTIENAYVRIETLEGTKGTILIRTKAYVNQEAYQSGKECIAETGYFFTPSVDEDSPNFIKQGYKYLKTLPGFTDAKDA